MISGSALHHYLCSEEGGKGGFDHEQRDFCQMQTKDSLMNAQEFQKLIQENLQQDQGFEVSILFDLVRRYLRTPLLRSQENTALLLHALFIQDLVAAREAVGKYERQTRPWFVLSVVAVCTALGLAIIFGIPLESGNMYKQKWSTVMCIGMASVCLVLLPRWRRQVPRLQQELDSLEAMAQHFRLNKPPAAHQLQTVLDIKQRIVKALRKGNYKDPFPKESSELLHFVSLQEQQP